MKGKIWFAKKQSGEIIALTELEALTHFESNNIANRMRLHFLGTSDGKVYNQLINEAKSLKGQERADKVKEAFDKELEVARANGVEEPDHTLRISTFTEAGKATGKERKKILEAMQ